MSIDSYSPCPGGTGKKVKFCCTDLVGELEKIGRMLEGKQQQACLDHIERLETKFPGRACLLTTKAYLQHGLGQEEQARQTAHQVLAAHPDNPVALAQSAIFDMPETGALASVEPLQRAIAVAGSTIDPSVLEAIGLVAVGLLNEGHFVAALAHAMLAVRIAPDDRLSANLMFTIMQNPGVPLPIKDTPQSLSGAPEGAPWKAAFDEALDAVTKARWSWAAERFETIAAMAPDSPPVWRNLALLRGYLGDEARAAEACRRYAALDVSLDDAADALLLAYFLDGERNWTQVDLISMPYPIADQERLAASLASDRRMLKLPIDRMQLPNDDGPPPRSVHLVFDKPLAQTGVGLSVESVSEVLGRIFVYGRETDREARLELFVHRDQLAAAADVLAQVTGDALRAAEAEEILGSTLRLQRTLGGSWHLPDDTPPDTARQLVSERRDILITGKWMVTANDLLAGRAPSEAAAAGAPRANLLAALRVLELGLSNSLSSSESATLRARLGLPDDEPIDPALTPPANVRLAQLFRLMVEKLSDEDLKQAFRRAAFARVRPALEKLANEMMSRPSLDGQIDKAEMLGVLAENESDSGKALELIGKARAAAEAAGRSSAPWDLDELELLLAQGEGEAAMRPINHVQAQHRREPGVMERLLQLLYDAGLVDEHGRPTQPRRAEPAGLVLPGATAEPGKLWTPGSELGSGDRESEASGSGKKAGLWMPGME